MGFSDTGFRPDDLLNREQAATMFTRMVKKMSFEEWTFATDDQFRLEFSNVPTLSDDDEISLWAKESIYFMLATGVITDLQDNAFSPRTTTERSEAMDLAGITREQALVLAARMVTRLR